MATIRFKYGATATDEKGFPVDSLESSSEGKVLVWAADIAGMSNVAKVKVHRQTWSGSDYLYSSHLVDIRYAPSSDDTRDGTALRCQVCRAGSPGTCSGEMHAWAPGLFQIISGEPVIQS